MILVLFLNAHESNLNFFPSLIFHNGLRSSDFLDNNVKENQTVERVPAFHPRPPLAKDMQITRHK